MQTNRTIDANEVHSILMDCLFRDSEIVDGKPNAEPVISEGVMRKFGLHPDRVKRHAGRIHELLMALPDSFHEDKGGGMSFLSACMDADGNHWGEHQNMDELFVLGMAAGKCRSVLPREMWEALPGGMPYYAVSVATVTA